MSKTLKVQEFSKDELVTQITNILNFIRTNNRFFSSNKISSSTNTSTFLVDEVINNLSKLPYIKEILTPTGKLKNFTFDFYCKGIVFFNPFYVVVDGCIVEGSNYRSASMLDNSSRLRLKYKDVALQKNFKFIESRLSNTDVADDLFNSIFVNSENAAIKESPIKLAEPVVPEVVDNFAKFPFCKNVVSAKIQAIRKLENAIYNIIENDKSMKAEYEKQMQLARAGKRTKILTDHVIVGKEDIYMGTVRSSTSFSSFYDDSVDHIYETVNVWESRYREVADYPKEPVYKNFEIEKLQGEIKTLKGDIHYIEKNLYAYEERFKKEDAINQLEIDYKKKQADLTREYKEALRRLQ